MIKMAIELENTKSDILLGTNKQRKGKIKNARYQLSGLKICISLYYEYQSSGNSGCITKNTQTRTQRNLYRF